MRHLRLLEGYLDNYYEEMDREDVEEEIQGRKIPMEEIYFLKLKKLGFSPVYFNTTDTGRHRKSNRISYMKKHVFRGLGDKIIYHVLSFATFGSYQEGFELFVYQLEDDYFFLNACNDYKWYYYKCDQFEGLIQLLKDKGWYGN